MMNNKYQESDNRCCCGTCRWHRRDYAGDWVCCNDQSENLSDWTDYEDSCEEWEGRPR